MTEDILIILFVIFLAMFMEEYFRNPVSFGQIKSYFMGLILSLVIWYRNFTNKF